MSILDSLDKSQINLIRYVNDPVIFTKELLGLECKPFHQEWLEAFENNQFVTLLAPRGYGKTTIIGSYILWRICRNRKIRCLIVTINQDKANSMMTFIQENLSSNEKLKETFGEFRGYSSWTRDQIRVKQTDGQIPHNEPTLKVLGVNSSIISSHYDLIILDDITDNENSKTEHKRRELVDWYKGPLIGTFLSNTKVIDVGTRWHEDDIHSFLMKRPGYKSLRYQALLNPKEVDLGKEAEVLWPEHLPWDEEMRDKVNKTLSSKGKKLLPDDCITLKFIREHQGEHFFQMQYQNNIIPSGKSKFKAEWIKSSIDKWNSIGIIPKDANTFIGVDIGGEDVASDWGVVTVVAVDSNGDIFIPEQIRTHSTISRQFQIMETLDDKYHPSKIGMESVAQQKHMVSDVARRNPNLPIIPIKTSRVKDRGTRTDRLSVLFESNRIYLNPRCNHLIDELKIFPYSKHDDCIDSLSFAIEVSGETPKLDWNKVPDTIIARNTYSVGKI